MESLSAAGIGRQRSQRHPDGLLPAASYLFCRQRPPSAGNPGASALHLDQVRSRAGVTFLLTVPYTPGDELAAQARDGCWLRGAGRWVGSGHNGSHLAWLGELGCEQLGTWGGQIAFCPACAGSASLANHKLRL